MLLNQESWHGVYFEPKLPAVLGVILFFQRQLQENAKSPSGSALFRSTSRENPQARGWPLHTALDTPQARTEDPKSVRAMHSSFARLLGGSWDLVTTYNWAYNPTYNPPKWAYRGYPKGLQVF